MIFGGLNLDFHEGTGIFLLVLVLNVYKSAALYVALAGAIAGAAASMFTKKPNLQRGLTMILSVAATAFVLWLTVLFS